ncbi:MAG: uroporphyrinogen-III synthase [Thermoplasmata archaeon]
MGRRGIRLVRLDAVVASGSPPGLLAQHLDRFGPYDTVALSSRAAVTAFVRPLRRHGRLREPEVEFWAVGPETARALRLAGVRRVRRARAEGAEPLRRALAGRQRRIVCPRSDRAGPALARSLKADGHRVLDLIAYRVRAGPRLSPRERSSARAAAVVIATSPSAITHFRAMVDRPTFDHLARAAQWVVLGPRTAAAARGHGLRRIGVAPSASVQRFTPYLLGVLAHATS